MSGWDQAKAQEVCREERAEYKELTGFVTLPVCLVRRETQCQCGRTNREAKIVGGVEAERNEYPWQGNKASLGSLVRESYPVTFNFQSASLFAPLHP